MSVIGTVTHSWCIRHLAMKLYCIVLYGAYLYCDPLWPILLLQGPAEEVHKALQQDTATSNSVLSKPLSKTVSLDTKETTHAHLTTPLLSFCAIWSNQIFVLGGKKSPFETFFLHRMTRY